MFEKAMQEQLHMEVHPTTSAGQQTSAQPAGQPSGQPTGPPTYSQSSALPATSEPSGQSRDKISFLPAEVLCLSMLAFLDPRSLIRTRGVSVLFKKHADEAVDQILKYYAKTYDFLDFDDAGG